VQIVSFAIKRCAKRGQPVAPIRDLPHRINTASVQVKDKQSKKEVEMGKIDLPEIVYWCPFINEGMCSRWDCKYWEEGRWDTGIYRLVKTVNPCIAVEYVEKQAK